MLLRVLVVVDLFAHFVLRALEVLFFLRREVATVLGFVLGFALLDLVFTVFQVRSLTGTQLSVLDSVGNAILLVLLASVDVVLPAMASFMAARADIQLLTGR